MTERGRPILWSAPMVRAILNTRAFAADDASFRAECRGLGAPRLARDSAQPHKVVTRRLATVPVGKIRWSAIGRSISGLLKGSPLVREVLDEAALRYWSGATPREDIDSGPADARRRAWAKRDSATGQWSLVTTIGGQVSPIADLPHYQPGEILWGRETFAFPAIYDESPPSAVPSGTEVAYRADAAERPPGYGRWRPGIHMPRWAGRIEHRVESAVPEPLWRLSPEDVVLEGVQPAYWLDALGSGKVREHVRLAFAGWDDLYASRPAAQWAANPVVWVINLRRLERQAGGVS